MKIRPQVLVAGIAGVLLSSGGSRIWAQTVTVGGCAAGAAYSTIQAAVDAASPGSTVDVCPGNYPEQVLIAKALTLEGIPSNTADAAVILSPSSGVVANATSLGNGNSIAAQILVRNADGVNIRNLAVDGSNNGFTECAPIFIGIYYQNASGTIGSVATRNQTLNAHLNGCQSGLGIFAESGNGGHSALTVENSSVRAYQKNGITGNEPGTKITIRTNAIVGQGPTDGAAENGIQIGFGATGQITRNSIIDNVFAPATASASGILVIGSSNVVILLNTVGTAQGGIVVFSDPSFGPADNALIERNTVFGANSIDGIEVCSNNNRVALNRISNSLDAAVHLDGSCTSTGNSNTVVGNVINEACAGILQGNGTTNNTLTGNTFVNVTHTLLQADGCSDLVTTPSGPSVRNGRSIGGRQDIGHANVGHHNVAPARP